MNSNQETCRGDRQAINGTNQEQESRQVDTQVQSLDVTIETTCKLLDELENRLHDVIKEEMSLEGDPEKDGEDLVPLANTLRHYVRRIHGNNVCIRNLLARLEL